MTVTVEPTLALELARLKKTERRDNMRGVVVLDVETSGASWQTCGTLEIGARLLFSGDFERPCASTNVANVDGCYDDDHYYPDFEQKVVLTSGCPYEEGARKLHNLDPMTGELEIVAWLNFLTWARGAQRWLAEQDFVPPKGESDHLDGPPTVYTYHQLELLGHNLAGFDVPLGQKVLERHNQLPEWGKVFSYRTRCTQAAATFLYDAGALNARGGLKQLCEHFGIEYGNHRALPDAICEGHLYAAMVRDHRDAFGT